MASSSTPTAAAGLPLLQDMPEELISHIAVKLGCDDLGALRLTCRSLEAKSFHEFATEHFAAKAVMFTTESLKVLIAISENERLRKYLHAVYITTASFTDKGFHYCPNGCHCKGQPTVRELEAFRFYQTDQRTLKKTHEDRNMLARAFKQLPNLAALTLADSPVAVRVEVDYRGSRKVHRTTGRNPTYAPDSGVDHEYERWQMHVWKTVMLAVAQSGITSLKSLATALIKGGNNGLTVADGLKFGPKAVAGLGAAFRSVESIDMQLRSALIRRANGTIDTAASRTQLQHFAGLFAAPKHLILASDSAPNTMSVHSAFVNNLRLTAMTTIKLSAFDIGMQPFMTTLSRLPVIKQLFLIHINLMDGFWVPILKLLEKKPTLEHLHLFYIRENGQKAYVLKQAEPHPHHHHHHHDDPNEWGETDDWGSPPNDPDYNPEDDDSDGEMPDLEPGPTTPNTNPFAVPPASALNPPPSSAPKEPPRIPLTTGPHASPDHVCPGLEPYPERGYYVCLHTPELLSQQLPIFMAEYNCGEQLDDDGEGDMDFDDGFGGPALPGMPMPAGALGDFFNNLVAAVGPPQGFPMPAAAGGGPAAGGAGGAGVPPPGFMTVGGGPGYGMMMGSFPITVNGEGPTGVPHTHTHPHPHPHPAANPPTQAAQANAGNTGAGQNAMGAAAGGASAGAGASAWMGTEQDWADTDHESEAGAGAADVD